ncbi:MAG: 16S rRNA (cytosine(1402)-N(4))-methyltransferase RsmH [Sandaracinaceae bacterium]
MSGPSDDRERASGAGEASPFVHATVMLRETLDALDPKSGGFYADATIGGGGHAEGILERSAPDGRLFGVDRDPSALMAARERLARFGDRVTLVHGAFSDLERLLNEHARPRIDGVVADLGVSSPQLDRAERGFSFRTTGPLDMRMDPTRGPSARDLIHETSERELADLIYQLGEERKSRPIARSIKRADEANELETTDDLRRAVVRAVGPQRRGGIDPATRTFQALRIAVNRELAELDALLEQLPSVLEDDGVAVVISFHSLEDRKVKRFFRGEPTLAPLTKRPLIADDAEQATNPRSRSAKLRAARRVPRAA